MIFFYKRTKKEGGLIIDAIKLPSPKLKIFREKKNRFTSYCICGYYIDKSISYNYSTLKSISSLHTCKSEYLYSFKDMF